MKDIREHLKKISDYVQKNAPENSTTTERLELAKKYSDKLAKERKEKSKEFVQLIKANA